MPKKITPSDAAKALSKLGASKGGKARAAKLSPERRKEIAKKAVTARWLNWKPRLPTQADQEEISRRLGVFPLDESILCKCGWHGDRCQLVRGFEVEISHPNNKGKWAGSPDLYKTFMEECPKCGRLFFADGQCVRPLHPEK